MLDAVKEMRRLSFHLVGKNCFHINAEHAGKIFCCWNALYLAVLRCCLADYVKILQQNACRMCSTTSFPHSTIRVSDLWRCLWPLSFLNRELKQRTFLIHGRQPEVWIWASQSLRMCRGFWREIADVKAGCLPCVLVCSFSSRRQWCLHL